MRDLFVFCSLGIVFIAGGGALAGDEKVSCRFEDLTDHCSMLSPTGDYKIMMPDKKTYIPNLPALADKVTDPTVKSNRVILENIQKMQAEEQAQRLKLVTILDRVPSRKMSSLFKFQLLSMTQFLGYIFDESRPVSPQIQLLWPPESANPQMQTLDSKMVTNKLSKFFTRDQRKALVEIKDNSRPYDPEQGSADQLRVEHPLSKEMDVISEDRGERVRELVNFTRMQIIETIVGSKPEREWTPSERAAVEKVKNIKYNSGTYTAVKNHSYCLGLVPNAFYDEVSNSINICPSMYNYPDASIVSALGHEMGHSVDPCGAQFPLYKIDRDKWVDFNSKINDKNEALKNEDIKAISDHIGLALKANSNFTAVSFPLQLKDPNQINYFIENGVLTSGPEVPKFSQQGNRLGGYFLSDVYSCMVSKSGGAFRQTTAEEIDSFAELVASKEKTTADPQFNLAEEKKKIASAYTQFPQCASPRAGTQMREAIADWFGSRALGAFLEHTKLSTNVERLAPIANFASIVCLERSRIKGKDEKHSLFEIQNQAVSVLQRDADSHPADISRIEDISLSDPRVRKALNCKEESYTNCPHVIEGNLKTGTSQRRTE